MSVPAPFSSMERTAPPGRVVTTSHSPLLPVVVEYVTATRDAWVCQCR